MMQPKSCSRECKFVFKGPEFHQPNLHMTLGPTQNQTAWEKAFYKLNWV